METLFDVKIAIVSVDIKEPDRLGKNIQYLFVRSICTQTKRRHLSRLKIQNRYISTKH